MHHFSLTVPMTFIWNGIFTAPSDEWVHIARELQEYELFIVTSGTLYIANEKEEYCVSEGEYLIMGPSKRQYGSRASQCTFHWLHFLAPTMEDAFDIQIPETEMIPDISRLITWINQICYAKTKGYSDIACSYLFTSLIAELHFQLKVNQPMESQGVSIQKEHLCKQIKEYIRFNSLENIKIHALAKHFGYHEKYLSSVFKSTSGMGLKEYLLQVKLEYAKDMLLNTGSSISQIAQTIGYSDIHNFSHAFKKALGISPREFRNAFYVNYD